MSTSFRPTPSAAAASAVQPTSLLQEVRHLGADPAFDAIARLALTATGAGGSAIVVMRDDDALRALAHAGPLRVELTARPCPYAAVLRVGKPLRADDVPGDPRFGVDVGAARSVAAAPVLIDGVAVAAVIVCDAERQRFDARTDDALADVAEVAAASIRAHVAQRVPLDQGDASRALAEERWRFALDVSSEGVWDWDLLHDRMYVSAAWCSLLGIDESERPLNGEGWARLIHPDDLGAARSRLFAHLRGETDSYSGEYRMRHGDGRWLWMHNRGKVVERSAGGRAKRLVGTLADTTERRAAEMARRDKHAAELANQAKNRFLSRMSHEMRTPLNAVIGFSQLMQSGAVSRDPLRVREYAGHALKAGYRLLELVDDVLDLQVLDEGGGEVAQTSIALRTLVLRGLESMQAQADACDVQLQCDVPDGLSVIGDPDRLLQVVRSLTSNAVKYNRRSGRATWSAAVDGETISLSLQDTGIGIGEAQLARLFQPFERLGRESGPIEGTGLGLIIARSSTERMGGRLSLASEPGIGTRVTLELRRAQPVAPVDVPAPVPAAPLRLLYVEDNRVNALLFSEAMRGMANIEMRVAEDGAEALEAVSGWTPDVLVLDAHLPGMNGYEVLQKLRAIPGLEATPAFMCSADAMTDDLRRARSAGFAGYWTKPIDVSLVLAELQRLATTPR